MLSSGYKLISKLQVFFLTTLLFTPFYVCSDDNKSSTPSNSIIQIFVNSSVPDQKYTLADIRAIFAMRKTHWNDGKRIQVFVLPDTDHLHRQFTKSNLNMFPHQFRRIWDRLIFSGTGQAPTEVVSIDEMQNMIATVPGAIGYLNTQAENTELRVLNYE